ncbi:WYL domain-containing protein [Demequina capsici]|uniref:WYL domain-containing protein n=1 Tax=Demequina capsici TaxID=3075620 RepID=A0AA96FFW5_9MICO|nr:WYL domain-containing protein [Demequina sp. PMTSA13]WNM28702.1 WYL domain-containing protein [Demequina sp. PMTSA13]
MAEKALARVTRLLSILSVLQHQEEATFAELGERFGVSARQIEQDVFLLFTTGKPGGMPDDYVDFDPDALDEGIARLRDAQGLTQVKLSAREAVALIGSLGTLVAAGVAPQAAETALAKLRAAIDSNPIEVVADEAVDRARMSPLTDGLARGLAVELTYVDASDRRTVRVVEPHRLVAIDGIGYVECWCRRAQDYRTLRLDRIVSATPTDSPVTTAPMEQRGFSLEPRFAAQVTAHVSARWLLESMQDVVISDEGDAVTATFPVADVEWAAGRLLAVGPALRTIGPALLADAVARRALRVLEAQDGAA